jgi:hypothetical protein
VTRTVDIDTCWERLCAQLPPALQSPARSLAARLGLAPAGVPWSRVFKHDVTLAAPALLAEGMSIVPVPVLDAAVAAHMLAVVEAFGRDRLADGQVSGDAELVALLDAVADARDRSAQLVDSEAPERFAAADRRTRRAIERERRLLAAARPVSLSRYRSVSLGKQAVGFPASRALAARVKLGSEARGSVEEVLRGVWLGLQHHDDVVDWEDDWSRGGAWSVCLARGAGLEVEARPGGDPAAVRAAVLRSGALAAMLELSESSFLAAAAHANRLGAASLSAWATERAAVVGRLCVGERDAPGWTVRAHRLAFWAAEVME